jgi:predicted transcriptional regulator
MTHLAVPNEFLQQIDEVARHTGKQREEIMLEALEAYLAQITEEDAGLEAAIAEADRGEVIDASVIHAEDAAFLAGLGLPPEQLTAIRDEARREAEAFYDRIEQDRVTVLEIRHSARSR